MVGLSLGRRDLHDDSGVRAEQSGEQTPGPTNEVEHPSTLNANAISG